MGDQEFIDQWKLTQEEYSFLINGLEAQIVSTPVAKQPVTSTLGTTEVLYAVRRGGPTTLSSQVVTVTKPVEKVVSAKVLTTSSFISEPVAVTSSNIWRSELPAYSIIHPVDESKVTTTTLVHEPVTQVASQVRYVSAQPTYVSA